MHALRELELEQQASTIHSRVHLVASAVSANDFSVLKEYTAPRALEAEDDDQQASANKPQAEHAALTVVADDYSALEERVVRMIQMVKQGRQDRMAAEERASHAEAGMNAQALRIEALERELDALKHEHQHGRQRVDQMMHLLDSLQL
jgi:hypothetical protein